MSFAWTPFPLSDGLDFWMLTIPDAFFFFNEDLYLSESISLYMLCISSTDTVDKTKRDR